MSPELLSHLKANWPLALAAGGLALYLPVALASGVFYTNQGWIRRDEAPADYWRWILRFSTLLIISLATLAGSYYLKRAS